GGISHTIGAVLGGFANVPHGATACLSLPAVLRWSRAQTEPRQQEICACLGKSGQSLDAVLTELIALLGLPQRMLDVGVREQQYAEIAEKVMLNQPPFQ